MERPGKKVGRSGVWGNHRDNHSSNVTRDHSKSTQENKNSKHNDNELVPRKFEEACAAIQANLKKHVGNLTAELTESESSSEEEPERSHEIVSSVCSIYGNNDKDLGKIKQLVQDSLQTGANVCLICIATVKKTDAIWTCGKCFCSLHLTCIQRWAKDSVYYQSEAANDSMLTGNIMQKTKFTWCCPKCRESYLQNQIPSHYYCYCGKLSDPKFDPWIVPHSCGSVCGKPLVPNCSHTCLLLCHPGPCPPCPKTVSVTCYCGKSSPQSRRCSNQNWSCSQICSKPLSCGQHQCAEICHSGDCPPCPKTSLQYCCCGKIRTQRPCDAINFQCDKVCGKDLECGHHMCSVICHTGQCPPCPLTLKRTCPCGKRAEVLPCTLDIPTCRDTCSKLLECGIHFCAERCHKGKCGTCLQMRLHKCRCGLKEKELPCYKELVCEIKCKRVKDCRRHPCNRKCCPGNCPPCDQLCNRALTCKNHKCASRCHQGQCYPCYQTVKVACNCGRTTITVPCGIEKRTKPPKCMLTCRKPPDCHHLERTPHVCHAGPCPPCRQQCKKIIPKCNHICPAPCHSSVLVKISKPELPRTGPWEPILAPQMEKKELPCPPCQVPIPVTCLGGHETIDWPCHKAVPSSCQRPCGRTLACTNHRCSKPCHSVDSSALECEVCESECTKPRPIGCSHPCNRGKCHPGRCPPCSKISKHSCHCGLNPQFIRCSDWTNSTAEEQLTLLSCKDQCPKQLNCGHRCPLICHKGQCINESDCNASVVVTCPCKRLKKTISCHNRMQQIRPVCDDVCRRKKEQELKVQEDKERQRLEEEERRNREEVQLFQRKFERRRRDKRHHQAIKQNSSHRYIWKITITLVLMIVLFTIMYNLGYLE